MRLWFITLFPIASCPVWVCVTNYFFVYELCVNLVLVPHCSLLERELDCGLWLCILSVCVFSVSECRYFTVSVRACVRAQVQKDEELIEPLH